MKKCLTLAFFVFMCCSSLIAQSTEEKMPMDSLLIRKYSLDNKNEAAKSGKYKNFIPEILYDRETNSYYLSLKEAKGYHVYIQIKDQDDNVILFQETNVESGNTKMKFDTEEGEQKSFTVSFQEIDGSKSAIYAFESYDELVYIYGK